MANNDSVPKRPIDELVAELSQDPDYIVDNFKYLLRAGVTIENIDDLVAKADPLTLWIFLDDLLEAGADVDKLVARMKPEHINRRLEKLIKAGADIDKLVARMSPEDVCRNYEKLCEAGADIDVNALLAKLEPVDIAFNLTALNEAGANINGDKLFASLESQDIEQRLRNSCRRPDTGADADRLAARIDCENIFWRLGELLEAGADPVGLLARLDLRDVERSFKIFLEAGVPNEVMARLEELDADTGLDGVVRNNIKDFLDAGADIHQVARWLIAESRCVNVRHVS